MGNIKKNVISLICDKCGKEFNFPAISKAGIINYNLFNNIEEAEKIALRYGWSVFNGIHICPKCTTIEKNGSIIYYQVY